MEYFVVIVYVAMIAWIIAWENLQAKKNIVPRNAYVPKDTNEL
ncbi:MAG: hypothetical protein NTX72_04280 [Candidatus Uhrbacteria bacterium]|nr:hypothetical protein [Candidatus Uhrbacteria bacterium]